MDTDDIAEDIALGNAKVLAETGLLTEREAQAHVLTRVYDWSVERAVAIMGVSPSRVYNARDAAAKDLDAARETLAMLDELETDEPAWTPGHCAECGDALAKWTVADGHVVCPECGGLDDA